MELIKTLKTIYTLLCSKARFILLNLLIPMPIYVIWVGFGIGHIINGWAEIPWMITSMILFIFSCIFSFAIIDKTYDTDILQ